MDLLYFIIAILNTTSVWAGSTTGSRTVGFLVMYSGVPFSVSYTSNYRGDWNLDMGTGLQEIYSHRLGGCIANGNNPYYPFGQNVSGNLKYYRNGSLVKTITSPYYPGLCNSGYLDWGSLDTTTLVYFNVLHDINNYVEIYSLWMSDGSTVPAWRSHTYTVSY